MPIYHVDKITTSVNRLNAMYQAQCEERDEKVKNFKINLAWVLTVVCILGIVLTIL